MTFPRKLVVVRHQNLTPDEEESKEPPRHDPGGNPGDRCGTGVAVGALLNCMRALA